MVLSKSALRQMRFLSATILAVGSAICQQMSDALRSAIVPSLASLA
jgi:hypothetical protein